MALLNIVFFTISVLALVKAGGWVVINLTRIAALLKMKEFVIGFILMAFSTTMPELFVGITSAFNKNSSLSLGDVLGSNIVNVTLIMGIIAILGGGIRVDLKTEKIDMRYMMIIAAVPLVLLIDGKLSRIDGVILLAAFVYYIGKQLHRIHLFTKPVNERSKELSVFEGLKNFGRTLRSFAIFVASILLLFFSAQFVVKYGLAMASDLHMPPILIGLVAIAIGTSLPELSFGARAVLAREGEMAIGDIIGAVVINSTLVLGVVSIIYPIEVDMLIFLTSAVFMLIVLFIFTTFAESGKKLSTNEGISLVLLYIFFMIVQFYIQIVQV